jgi:hypothetical protein
MDGSGRVRGERNSKFRTLLLCWIALTVIAGCRGGEDKYDRLPFSGTVTLDGKPLASGYVIFMPKDGQPTQSTGMISEGKFEVTKKAGTVAGKYAVAIFSGAESSTGNAAAGTPEAELAAKKNTRERVPRKYNIDSILTVEIERDKENVFRFDLTTK